jgi:hypothetical protein
MSQASLVICSQTGIVLALCLNTMHAPVDPPAAATVILADD